MERSSCSKNDTRQSQNALLSREGASRSSASISRPDRIVDSIHLSTIKQNIFNAYNGFNEICIIFSRKFEDPRTFSKCYEFLDDKAERMTSDIDASILEETMNTLRVKERLLRQNINLMRSFLLKSFEKYHALEYLSNFEQDYPLHIAALTIELKRGLEEDLNILKKFLEVNLSGIRHCCNRA